MILISRQFFRIFMQIFSYLRVVVVKKFRIAQHDAFLKNLFMVGAPNY